MKKLFTLFILLFLVFSCKTKQSKTSNDEVKKTAIKTEFPKQLGYVSDFDNVLTNEETNKLTRILSQYETQTTNQIAIVSITKDLTENNFDQYALDLSNNWGIGKSKKDNGLTIIFSVQLRKIRICTGSGTEKILTDQICEKVLDEKILPEFKKENYSSGLTDGINEFKKLWK
ncbi:YgcG family protein [Chryseobacterium sp. MDT2-18]|uniref:TPM domain-containing protein n=1 Tax=Chryseobacterium sp. MDT2-18 TaxID=1259136 RepID=UPI0027893C0A|nr:TPM domain-containing protein [Chryseobacterium sp. MDT2-18]MDQ0477053.1 uncharacterized protein [Chryseobacterium sp. MDT2-18]